MGSSRCDRMSEKRFKLDYEEDDAIFIVEDDDIVYPIRNDTIKEHHLQNLVDKLNEQQNIIESERDLFEKYKASAIRDMRDYSDKIIEMQKKVDEQQATIQSLKEENEKLKKQINEYNLILKQHEFAEKEGFK